MPSRVRTKPQFEAAWGCPDAHRRAPRSMSRTPPPPEFQHALNTFRTRHQGAQP